MGLVKFFDWLAEKLPNFGERTITDLFGDKYLRRIYLTPRGINHGNKWLPSVFLHKFYRSDHDRDPHNHPWKLSISLILAGGYTEYRLKNGEMVKRKIHPGMINVIKKDTYHRVNLHQKEGAWTLFISFSKEGDDEWGFMDMDNSEYVPWRDYLKHKGFDDIPEVNPNHT